MSLLPRPVDASTDTISIPWPVQVYTHPLPDGRTCYSAWAQHTCSCGVHALTWETKAVAWGGVSQAIKDLTLIPDNHGVISILAEAIEGPYDFVHHAMLPYVTVRPSTPGTPITIRMTPRLQLMNKDRSRQLQGPQDTMTLAVMLDRHEERLVEVNSTRRLTRPKKIGTVAPHTVPLPQSLAVTPPISAPKPARLVVAPIAPEQPPPVDAPIPEILAAVCRKEDVHPELDDYLVIPTSSVPEADVLPRWVVRSPLVEQIRVVKPRLKVDRPFGGEEVRYGTDL